MIKNLKEKILKKMVRTMYVKKDGGKEILIELGLAVIGVVLLVMFRTQVTAIITDVGTKVSTAISSLFGNVIP